jgi:Transcriptional regulator, AbiEi antitoxin
MHTPLPKARILPNTGMLTGFVGGGGHTVAMVSELPSTLRNLAGHQSGVVSRSQALRAGLSRDMIKFRVRSGWWRPVHPGVYLTFTGTPGRSAQLWAALLGAGPGAILSHETAAELQRLSDRPTEAIHVTVPWQRRIASARGVSLHRSRRAAQIPLAGGDPPLTAVEETVLDLTQTAATFDDVCGWVTRAFARDLTDAGRLLAAMELRPNLRWRADLRELIAAAASGNHSVLEYRYDRDVERAHGLPKPVRQAPFAGPEGRRGRRDRLYRRYGVVVELDGRLSHGDEDKWRDQARDNAAAVTGQQTLRYGWAQVTRHACATAAEVAQVLRVHGWAGSPRPCSAGCPVQREFLVGWPPDRARQRDLPA